MEEKTISNVDMYEILKQRIIRLEYAPGQVLNEKEVAGEFNLSRTPVRKVFEQLKNNKLLNIIPRYGAQVAPIDFLYTKSVFEVVRELEGYAARLAAEKMPLEKLNELEAIVEKIRSYNIVDNYKKIILEDQHFHSIIYENSGNPCLIEVLNDLHMHTERMWLYAQPEIRDIGLFLDTMPNIINALKARDAEQAGNYTKSHIDIFVEQIKQELL